MAKIGTGTFSGITGHGEKIHITYDKIDNSGVDNDAIFNGTIVPPTVDPSVNNWTPQGMNEPKPPRGKGE
jgi:hypothetical protein